VIDLISFDIISLFTNIPISLALEGLTKRWDEIKKGTSIPINEFMEGVKMILDSTVFTFNPPSVHWDISWHKGIFQVKFLEEYRRAWLSSPL